MDVGTNPDYKALIGRLFLTQSFLFESNMMLDLIDEALCDGTSWPVEGAMTISKLLLVWFQTNKLWKMLLYLLTLVINFNL